MFWPTAIFNAGAWIDYGRWPTEPVRIAQLQNALASDRCLIIFLSPIFLSTIDTGIRPEQGDGKLYAAPPIQTDVKTALTSLDSKPKFCNSADELLALSIVDFPGAISMGARSWLVIILSSLFGLACPSLLRPAYAQEAPSAAGSWWNPLTWGASSSDPSVRESTYFNGEPKKAKSKSAAWSLPSLSWGAGENKSAASSTKPRGPSMFKKMGRSTRQAWNSTTDFLNPFNDAPAPPVNQGYQPQKLDKKTSSSGGGMFGWLKPTEPVEQPASVNDWLSQDRPRF